MSDLACVAAVGGRDIGYGWILYPAGGGEIAQCGVAESLDDALRRLFFELSQARAAFGSGGPLTVQCARSLWRRAEALGLQIDARPLFRRRGNGVYGMLFEHGLDRHIRNRNRRADDVAVIDDGDGFLAAWGEDGPCYRIDAGGRHCSCPDYRYRGLPCKHLIAVRRHLARSVALADRPLPDLPGFEAGARLPVKCVAVGTNPLLSPGRTVSAVDAVTLLRGLLRDFRYPLWRPCNEAWRRLCLTTGRWRLEDEIRHLWNAPYWIVENAGVRLGPAFKRPDSRAFIEEIAWRWRDEPPQGLTFCFA